MSNKNFIKATTLRRKMGVRKYPQGSIFVNTLSNAVFIQMSSYCVSWHPLGKDINGL